MEGKRFLRSIELKNLLSYGPEGVKLELEPLNVLIGANATGKSNLIQALRLLQAAPRDIKGPPRWDNSGIAEWMWKGEKRGSPDLAVSFEPSLGLGLLNQVSYHLHFNGDDGFRVMREELFVTHDSREGSELRNAIAVRRPREATLQRSGGGDVNIEKLRDDESIFSQVRDSSAYPILAEIGDTLQTISFFGGWKVGDRLHQAQRADLPGGFLVEDGSNLGLALSDLLSRPGLLAKVVEKLRLIHEWVEHIALNVRGGFVEVTLHEKGLRSAVPATRLSDGTLHFLCLLTILLHPDPPPLVCIEEPELGLHPDAVSAIGELLIEASQRTQLIVTTHSPSLLSALSNVPEAVVVCEKDEKGTQLQRLEPDRLGDWLDEYSLGHTWQAGALGGNRW